MIRLTRNSRTELGCDEKLFKAVVKTAFGQRRKTLRNSLKPLLQKAGGSTPLTNRQINDTNRQTSDTIRSLSGVEGPVAEGPVFDLRPERLSVEDFIALTLQLQS